MISTRPAPRRVLPLLLAAVLLLAGLSACGGANRGGPAAGPGPAGGPFPVTVHGMFGDTTVPRRPVRVVAMSWTDADLALALGVVPVGIAAVPSEPDGLQPWTSDALRGQRPTIFPVIGGDPVEQIAALAPDLILATKDYNLDRSHDLLSQIAPLVSYVNGVNNDTWQQDLANVATALGLAEQGRRLDADTEAVISAQRARHPELAGKTFSYVISPKPTGVYTVNSPDDVSARLLGALGLRLSPPLTRLPTAEIPGRAKLSPENLGQLDADVVVAAGTSGELAQLAANPLFAALPSVRRGGYVPLDYATAGALAFPSPLSLRWALDRVPAKLAAAAAAH
jgi:iron complex transport system substrate-binding protein